MWKMLLAVAGAGVLGGLVNSVLSGTGLIFPSIVNVPGGTTLLPGFLGNVAAGAVAAFLSFGLYGPFSQYVILSSGAGGNGQPPLHLTLAALAGAALVGFSGGRWLTAEADKQLNQAAKAMTAEVVESLVKARGKSGPRPLTPLSSAAEKQALDLIEEVRSATPHESFLKAQQLRRLLDAPVSGPR